MTQQYHRVRQTNRQMDDYYRNILMYLDTVGPSSITDLQFRLETTSNELVKRALVPLIANEFIKRETFQSLGLRRPNGGRRNVVPARLDQRSNHIQILLVITKRGKELLKKQKELASFIRWKDG